MRAAPVQETAERGVSGRGGWALPAFFAVTLLIGSGLLFLVQPMCAKMVLPLLGGSPGVWNTCMVSFQAGLLAGYAYAHAGPHWLGLRAHAVIHLGLLALPLLLLPIALGETPPDSGARPALWLLRALVISAGLPFVMLASTAPLLQRWYAAAGARDPYFLYAASNLGSMAALLAYPFVVEPNFPLSRQSSLWTAGYVVIVVLSAGCALVLWRMESGAREVERPAPSAPPSALRAPLSSPAPTTWDKFSWLLFALVPSSLMLSITAFLTTDIAAIPLFWVVPLAIYLLTFILVFAGSPLLPQHVFVRWTPLMVLVLVIIRLTEATEPVGVLLGIHLLGLFWICMSCHGELLRRRPGPTYLTGFYLWLALGGVLGGALNALLAPMIFTSVVEYPLMLIAACVLLPGRASRAGGRGAAVADNMPKLGRPLLGDLLLALLLGLGTLGLVLAGRKLGVEPGPMSVAVMFAVPLLICYTSMDRPLRFGLGLAGILLAARFYPGVHGRIVQEVRSFFGVHRVTEQDGFRKLVHGNTVHGMQSLDPFDEDVPLTYYHRKGPVGELLTALSRDRRLEQVAVIGLGTGALACYSRPGQRWTFFEIDPEVIRIASPQRGLFTFWRSHEREAEVIAADGRLGIAGSSGRFGIIIVDAFNSDAIPVHLLTREALQVYRSRLKNDGFLIFHVSNRYLDLEPVLAGLADAADPPLVCRFCDDVVGSKTEGKFPSQWAVMAGSADDLNMLPPRPQPWRAPRRRPDLRLWTDDFSNLFQIFKWRDGFLESSAE